MNGLKKLVIIFKDQDLRKNIFAVLALLVIFRFAAHIPVPGIDIEAVRQLFAQNQLLGLLNLFSGSGMESFSLVALGVAPYITASIIFQLLTMVVPKLQELSKEGESGHMKISQYTRLLTIPLALVQSYGLISLLRQSSSLGGQVIGDLGFWPMAMVMLMLTAGSIGLMWIGELISERHVGNGVSLIIFAGIVSSLPRTIQQTLQTYTSSDLPNILMFLAIAVVTVAVIVYITEAQRNIPVAYARQIRGNRMYGGVNTHLPMRVNQAGVIPIIFAISLVLFPSVVAQFFVNARSDFISSAAQWVLAFFQNQLVFGGLYFVLVFAFTYFYTSVIFHPDQISENLQKSGGFIPGIRPGKETQRYLSYVSSRIILAGALFLSIVAVLPNIMQGAFALPTLVIGGTSVLIVVSVVIETMKQIDSQLVMRDYEST